MNRRSLLATVGALAAAATMLAGCSTGSADAGSAPTAKTSVDAHAFPVTIDHAYGSTTITKEPKRIVSIGSSDQDDLLALGVVPVGVQKVTWGGNAGGTTPWGTTLHGEENFNFYFDSSSGALDPRYTASYARYGILADPNAVNRRGWKEVDPRFDLSVEPHEPFRFGWVVELDPFDPCSTPRKHTMLGRAKHEGAGRA